MLNMQRKLQKSQISPFLYKGIKTMKYERVQLLSLKTIILKLVNVIFSQMMSTFSRDKADLYLIFGYRSQIKEGNSSQTTGKHYSNVNSSRCNTVFHALV